MARRVGIHHNNLKPALMKAALELIEEGASNPSLRQVAKRAGVSPGAPYHHFDSHASLLEAVAKEGFESLSADVSAQLGAGPYSLKPLVNHYALFAIEHWAHYQTMFRAALGTNAELASVAVHSFDRLVRACEQEFLKHDKKVSRQKTFECARCVWAATHGSLMLFGDGIYNNANNTPPEANAFAKNCGKDALRIALGFSH